MPVRVDETLAIDIKAFANFHMQGPAIKFTSAGFTTQSLGTRLRFRLGED